jgi:hypothetical protein
MMRLSFNRIATTLGSVVKKIHANSENMIGISTDLLSVFLYMNPPNAARQRNSKHVPAATNTRKNIRIVVRVVFYMVCVASNGSLWVCLCVPSFSICTAKTGPPLWSSGQSSWLQIQRSRVGFPALPDFLRCSESGTGFTQPHEDN